MYVFRSSFVDKTGRRIYAKWYGKRAFRFWVDDPDPTENTPIEGAVSGEVDL